MTASQRLNQRRRGRPSNVVATWLGKPSAGEGRMRNREGAEIAKQRWPLRVANWELRRACCQARPIRHLVFDTGRRGLRHRSARVPGRIPRTGLIMLVRTRVDAQRAARTAGGTPAGCFWCARAPRLVLRAPAGNGSVQHETGCWPSAFSRQLSACGRRQLAESARRMKGHVPAFRSPPCELRTAPLPSNCPKLTAES
jgi:hypothetical protein